MILPDTERILQPLARYEGATFQLAPLVKRIPHYAPPPTASGAILLIGFLAVLGVALTHICLIGATEPQAVAWACIVGGVGAALRKWA
jgi:hypothetical protein